MKTLEEVQIHALGYVTKSSFVHKWGTPRQGALTPDATAEISLLREIPPHAAHDRVAILWMAHLNGDSFNPLKSRIKPPKKTEGRRTVGVFATRGVHRPSPIGLTFCRILEVQNLILKVAGADMIEGTPILSIKSATPINMDPHTVRCPKWTEVKKISIVWSLGSFMALSLHGAKTQKTISSLIQSTLTQDPRSVHSLMKHVNPVYEVQLRVQELADVVWVIYRHHLDGIEVLSATNNRLVENYPSRSETWLKRLFEKIPSMKIDNI